MKYKTILTNTSSHQERTFFNADMVGSKKLAQSQDWTVARLYARAGDYFDLCGEQLARYGAERVRIEGDAIKAAFAPGNAHAAINAAIAIQEACEKAWGHEENPNYGAVGIATGPAADLGDDYLGMSAVIARHLALASSALAVSCCATTISKCDTSQIQSAHGNKAGRKAAEYVGAEKELRVPVAPAPIKYHEILWSKSAYGLKGKA